MSIYVEYRAICLFLLGIFWATGLSGCQKPLSDHRTPIDRVVDGDTVWAEGVKYRLIDLDAPEQHNNPSHGFKCEAERIHAEAATARAKELLLDQPIRILTEGKPDRYGRTLAKLQLPDGRIFGDVLIAEGLAVRWTGEKHDWCAHLSQ
ncbi:thermonuclease family protein [Litorimonas sp. WD9-15]|uniref:thermonuclease family protein n=1 Tax=Litorimonas sp. WD9-15 TaxID=3418716 RepID=UPI003D04D0E7